MYYMCIIPILQLRLWGGWHCQRNPLSELMAKVRLKLGKFWFTVQYLSQRSWMPHLRQQAGVGSKLSGAAPSPIPLDCYLPGHFTQLAGPCSESTQGEDGDLPPPSPPNPTTRGAKGNCQSDCQIEHREVLFPAFSPPTKLHVAVELV